MSLSRISGTHDVFQRIDSLAIDDDGDCSRLFVSLHRGKELYHSLLDEYVNGLPEMFLRLRKDLQTQNWRESRHKCHQLKGSLGTYGYSDLSRLFAWIDEWLAIVEKAATFPECGPQLSKIENIIASLTVHSAFQAAANRRARQGSSPWAMGV